MNCHRALIVLLMMSSLPAADPIRPERNAALQYWIAFAKLPEKDPDWLASMRTTAGGAIAVEAEQGDSPALRYLHLGASCPGGAFDSIIGIEAGGDVAEFPHLRLSRRLARLALARAAWRFEHGRCDEAINDCMAVFALAADLSKDSSLVEFLASSSIHSLTVDTLARYLPDCTQAERVGLVGQLGNQRLFLRSGDFPRVEAAIWRHQFNSSSKIISLQGGGQKSWERPAISAALAAAVKAGDPRVEVWIRETEEKFEEMTATIPRDWDEFLASQARLKRIAESDLLIQELLPTLIYVVEMARRQVVRDELLMAAAGAFDRSKEMRGLKGFRTIEGDAAVTAVGFSAAFELTQHGSGTPIKLVVGQTAETDGNGSTSRQADNF